MNYDPNQWQPQQPPPPPPQWTTQPGQWQQQSYQQPTQQWQQQPYYPQQPPPRQPKNEKAMAWFIIIAIFFVGGAIINGVTHGGMTGQSATPTAVAVTPTVQQATPTAKPTKRPAPKSTTKPVVAMQPTAAPQPTPKPQPVPTQPPAPTYNTDPNGGQLVYNPPADFCDNNACVTTFWTATNGYVVECGNGEFSHSGGVRGACSRDGGVAAILYQHG